MNVKNTILKNTGLLNEGYEDSLKKAKTLLDLVVELREKSGLEELDKVQTKNFLNKLINKIENDSEFFEKAKKDYEDELEGKDKSSDKYDSRGREDCPSSGYGA